MNNVTLMGRLTKDPDVRTSTGQKPTTIARFVLAVDRGGKKVEGEQSADFISCVAFGKTAEFIKNYVAKGTKLALRGRIQTGSYTAQDGRKVYTTDVVVEQCEFAESKPQNAQAAPQAAYVQPQAAYAQPYQQPVPQPQAAPQQAYQQAPPMQPQMAPQPQQMQGMPQPVYQQAQPAQPMQPQGQVPVTTLSADPNAPNFI